MRELEMCIMCDEPTGCAGEGEDSNYTEDGIGPLCDDCAEKEGVYDSGVNYVVILRKQV